MVKNATLFFVAALVALVFCEIGLRVATPYPVPHWRGDLPRSMVADRELGYRPRAATHAFAAEAIVAVGDSHTYGVGVTPTEAWPALLAKDRGVPIGNWSAPSYGVFSYHALVRRALDNGAELVVLGLYPGNDFYPTFSHCLIDFDTPFWREERRALDVDPPPPCKERPARQPNLLSRLKALAVDHSAIGQIVDRTIVEPNRALIGKLSGAGVYSGGLGFVQETEAQYYARAMDLADAGVAALLETFERMAARWTTWAADADAELAVLLIPNREVVIAAFADEHRDEPAPPRYRRDLLAQEPLHDAVISVLNDLAIPWVDAAPALVDAMARSETEVALAAFWDQKHPRKEGQAAYARATATLLDELPSLARQLEDR